MIATTTNSTPRPQPIRGPESHTEPWYAAHRTMLTASVAGAICGRAEYGTPRHIFELMTGRLPPFEGNQYTQLGQFYEPGIAKHYAYATGQEIEYPQPLYFHPQIAYLAATPDAAIVGQPKGVEIKYTMSPKRAAELGEEGTDWVPDDWNLQCQQQMDVMGWDACDMAVSLYGRLRIYTVPRSEKLIGLIHEAAAELWERIKNDDPPEFTWTHPRTSELIKALYGVQEGTVVALSADACRHWGDYRKLGQEIKERERQREEAKLHVMAEMGESAIGMLDDGCEVVRSRVERKEYTAKATSYVSVRERKSK